MARTLARVGFELGEVFVHRGGERVVVGGPALFLVVPDERWEIDHPGDLVIELVRIVELEQIGQVYCAGCPAPGRRRLPCRRQIAAGRPPWLASLVAPWPDAGGKNFSMPPTELLRLDLDPGAALAAVTA